MPALAQASSASPPGPPDTPSPIHTPTTLQSGETAMTQLQKALLVEEDGATMVEYALMVALIAAVAIAGATTIGSNVLTKFNTVGGSVGSAGGCGT